MTTAQIIGPACGAAIIAAVITNITPNPVYVCLWAGACFVFGWIVGKGK